MSQKFVDELESQQYIYNVDYMPVYNEDLKWAMENAIRAAGALDTEPTDAYFARIKRYAVEILKTKKQLADEVNGSIH